MVVIIDPNGHDNFTTVHGENLELVTMAYIFKTDSPTIPQIMCEKMPKIDVIFSETYNNIVEITDTSLSMCLNLKEFWWLGEKPLAKFGPKTFSNNPFLELFIVDAKQLTSFPATLFDNCPNMHFFSTVSSVEEIPHGFFKNPPRHLVEFHNCSLSQLHSLSFGDLDKLGILSVPYNQITSMDIRIFNRARNLQEFKAFGNICINEDFYEFASEREAIMEELRGCFEAFGIVNRGAKFLKIFFIFLIII